MKKILIVELVILSYPLISVAQDGINVRDTVNYLAKGLGYLVLIGIVYLIYRAVTKKSK